MTKPETANLKRAAYAGATLVLTASGWLAATRGGHPAGPVAVGLGAAWAVQASSFWLLAGALERGDRVMATWTGGIAARFGGLALLWGLLRLTGGPTREPVLAYAFAVVAFLLLEAAWLTWLRPGRGKTEEGRHGPPRAENRRFDHT